MKLGLLQHIATIMYFLWYPDGAQEMIPKNWRCPRPERTTSCAETMSKGLIHGAGPIWVMVISRNLLLKFWNLYLYILYISYISIIEVLSWHPPQGFTWIAAEVPDARPWAQNVPSALHPSGALAECLRRDRSCPDATWPEGNAESPDESPAEEMEFPTWNSLELLEEAFFDPSSDWTVTKLLNEYIVITLCYHHDLLLWTEFSQEALLHQLPRRSRRRRRRSRWLRAPRSTRRTHMGVSENSVPLNPMVLLIIIPIKWL
jgi:hypothetical protein